MEMGLNEFGKRKREQLNGPAAKRAKDSADILMDTIFKKLKKTIPTNQSINESEN